MKILLAEDETQLNAKATALILFLTDKTLSKRLNLTTITS